MPGSAARPRLPFSVPLRPRDYRSCLALINECRELGADSALWHRHLVDRLCELVNAQVGIGGNTRHLAPGKRPQSLGSFRRGWATESAAKAWAEYADRVPLTSTPEYNRLARVDGPLVTYTRDQLWDRGAWYRSATFNDVHKASGIDDYIISIAAARSQGVYNSVWLHRPVGAPPFTRREWYMVHLVHKEVGALIGSWIASAAEPGVSCIPPRLRETLDGLLDGDSEKQIAARMGLSVSTVHEYVGALYRHFAASSRAELMALFIGRARPIPADATPPVPPS